MFYGSVAEEKKSMTAQQLFHDHLCQALCNRWPVSKKYTKNVVASGSRVYSLSKTIFFNKVKNSITQTRRVGKLLILLVLQLTLGRLRSPVGKIG